MRYRRTWFKLLEAYKFNKLKENKMKMLQTIQENIANTQNVLEECLIRLEFSTLKKENLLYIEDNKEVLGVRLYRQFITYIVDEFFLVERESEDVKYLTMTQLIEVLESDIPLRYKIEYSESVFGGEYLIKSKRDYSFKIKSIER